MSNATTLSKGGLFAKVSLLLTGTFAISAVGTYLGAGITSFAAIITLGILFLVGAIALPFVAKKSTGAGIAVLAAWTFISGLFLGPCIHHYVQSLGWQTVFLAYVGTGGVMAACGAIGALSGRDFSNMGRWLMFALLGLIVVGIVNIFVSFSSGVTIVYSLIGMAVFAGFFIYDFFRLSKSEDTWFSAIMVTVELYLDFVNFLLYLLKLLNAIFGKSKD